VLKQAETAELETALDRVAAGEVFVSRHLQAADSANASGAGGPGALEHLTERQRKVLQMLAEGHTTKGIAYDLGVSPKTVEYHRAQLMTRLGIHDLPGLVRFALRVGLVGNEN
jgi:DNA-binding NarL/FixJ family response regulator